MSLNQPTDEKLKAITDEILAKRKINAIKLYRESTGAGLKESKEAIEAIESDLAANDPNFKALMESSKGGCMSLMIVGGVLAYGLFEVAQQVVS